MALVSYTQPILKDLAQKRNSVRKKYIDGLKDPEDIYNFETILGKEMALRKVPFKRSIKLTERPQDEKLAARIIRERKKEARETVKRIKELQKTPSKREQLKIEKELLDQLGIPSKRLGQYESELDETGELSKRSLVFSTPSFIKSMMGIDQSLKSPLFVMRSTTNPERLQDTLDEYINDVLMRYQRYMKRKEKLEMIIKQGFDTSSLQDDWDVIEMENSRLLRELENLGIIWNYKLSKTDIRRDNIQEIIQHLTAFHAELSIYNLINYYLNLWNRKYEQIHQFYSDSQFQFEDIKKQPYPNVSLLKEHYKLVDEHLGRNRDLREMIEKDLKRTQESTIRVLEESVDKNVSRIKNTRISYPLSTLLKRVLMKTNTLFAPSNFLVYDPEVPFDVKKEWKTVIRRMFSKDTA